ncbi:adenosylhomocysteine nucleosidase [Oxalobacteraceae bacterium GrIS 2.11]
MTIGIMAALHDEIAELIQILSRQGEVRRIGMRDFYVGELEGQACVVVLARVGKVAASATAVSLIREFGVTEIVFSGVAGGLAKPVKVGDVVIADKLIQHDMDARPIFPRYEIPLLGMSSFDTAAGLSRELQDAARHFLEHQLHACVPAQHLEQFGLAEPALHIGTIASGDQFIGLHQDADRLQRELPQVFAVEMEGAAVAQICHEYGAACAILRTISDRADASAHVDFTAFLGKVASKYSSGIVRRFLSQRSEQKPA